MPPKKKVFTEILRDFPAEIGISSGFPAEIGISSGFSNFKSTKNTNLGLDLRSKATNLLISSGHSFFEGAQFSFWGAQAVSWGGGARPRYAPRGAGSGGEARLAKPMLQFRKTKQYFQIFREVSGVFQQNFNGSKNSSKMVQKWFKKFNDSI